MKFFQCQPFFLSIILCLSCQTSQDSILIKGKISGEIPETIEYTDPIHGICHWGFKKQVSPDSLGHFRIEVSSKEAIFIKIRPAGGTSGTLIADPGKTYNIHFDLQENQESFTVTDPTSTVHEMYDQLPDPPHIQVGASEFFPDTIAAEIQSTIEERKNNEISTFQELYSKGEISEEVLSLLKSDRTCYYDAVTANIAFIKELRAMQRNIPEFPADFENMWRETFENPLFADPHLLKSPWFPAYAEGYIYFQEYLTGEFTMEKVEELKRSDQLKIYRANKIKEYLPHGLHENYLADFLFEEVSQKQYEKELVELFNRFRADYPQSRYLAYLTPPMEEIIHFQEVSERGFTEGTEFVADYQNLNSLSEITKKLPTGKIYVDVWATWCGPCKKEFGYREELESMLKQKNISTLYISLDRDQDSLQWNNMIKYYDLKGYHVRANKTLEAELREIFDNDGIISIPWYLILDHNGNILKKHAHPPSQKEKLEKELEG